MVYNMGADTVLVIHLLFILFVVFGGLLLFCRIGWLYWHLPAVLWAVVIECSGKTCPLTPLENWLRQKGAGVSYQGDFVAHYLSMLIYPPMLTRELQYFLGAGVLAINFCTYIWFYYAKYKKN